jgi:hypothetical protein
MDRLFQVLLASADMANEPEFEPIFISPLDSMETFIEVGEESGVDPDSLAELPDDEREYVELQIMEGTIRRLLTDEVRQDILKALNDLRLRLKRAGKPKEAAKAATLHSILSDETFRELWSLIGVVRAVFSRSVAAGFEMYEAAMEAMDFGPAGESRPSLLQRLLRSKPSAKADGLIRKIPGLTAYLERQADRIWEEGMAAIYAGDLDLALFSLEELEGGAAIFATTSDDTSEGAQSEERRSGELTGEDMMVLKRRLDSYVAELFTPRRCDQLRMRLGVILEESEVDKRWDPFVLLLFQYAGDEDSWEYVLTSVLPRALLGELRAVSGRLREAVEEGNRKNRQE